MTVTWLGHACFLMEHDGYRIVTDPYEGVPGYPELRTQAHAVFCSHGHGDHNAVHCVTMLPPVSNPFTVREIAAFHDDQGGALRGNNTIRVFTSGGISVAHLGDLGHPLTLNQLADLGVVDVLLIPVGGYYTIDAKQAKAVCDSVGAHCVVPMHYHHPPYGLPVVGGVEDFLKLWPKESVHRLNGPSFTVTAETSGVVVPKFGGKA